RSGRLRGGGCGSRRRIGRGEPDVPYQPCGRGGHTDSRCQRSAHPTFTPNQPAEKSIAYETESSPCPPQFPIRTVKTPAHGCQEVARPVARLAAARQSVAHCMRKCARAAPGTSSEGQNTYSIREHMAAARA